MSRTGTNLTCYHAAASQYRHKDPAPQGAALPGALQLTALPHHAHRTRHGYASCPQLLSTEGLVDRIPRIHCKVRRGGMREQQQPVVAGQ